VEVETSIGKAFVPRDLIKYSTGTDPVAKRFVAMKRLYYKGDKNLPPAENILHLAGWALEHGLLKEFAGEMDNLIKADPKSAAAYVQLRKDMERSVSGDEPGGRVVANLDYKKFQSPHYTLWANAATPDIQAKRYLEELERTYETFFAWFALKGRVLPVPTRRLVAVLEPSRDSFEQLRGAFDMTPLVADGFLARRENLAVLTTKPNTEAYQTLDKINEAKFGEIQVKRDQVLDDKVYKIRALGPMLASKPLDLYGYQTLALVQKAMEEESIRASTSHEGVRQLLAATGLIPRNVGAPEWVRFGLGSFLETSQKAFFHNPGLPSWLYLKPFKELIKSKDRERNEEMLARVISDFYFRHAHASLRQADMHKDDRESKEALQEKAAKEVEKARCTAWAFTYFLLKDPATRAQLEQFLAELAAMPRDQEFGQDVLIECFARSFGVQDAADPSRVDATKLQNLANRWVGAMEHENLEVDAKFEIPKKDDTKKKAPAPNNRFPGGFGAPPGGGSGAWLSPRERDAQWRLREKLVGRRELC
jgi:hypothetical protein